MSEEQFTELYNRCASMLVYFAYQRGFDWHTAEDIAHDSFERLLKISKNKKMDIDHAQRFLFGVAKGKCVDKSRKNQRACNYIDYLMKQGHKEDFSTDYNTNYQELNNIYELAVSELKTKHKLTYLEILNTDISQPEYAKREGISVKAVEKRLQVARSFVRNFIINTYQGM